MNYKLFTLRFHAEVPIRTPNGILSAVEVWIIYTEILSDTIPKDIKDYLNQKYWDSVQITCDSRGNIRMDYFGSGASGMDYNIYNAKKHLMYAKWKNADTTYYYDTSINEYHLDSTQRVEEPNGFFQSISHKIRMHTEL